MKKHFVWFGFLGLFVLMAMNSCGSKDKENLLIKKIWFTHTYERWNTNYYDQYIPDSYRSWTYTNEPGSENWFWYFLDQGVSYQIHTINYDTTYYPFEYSYNSKNNTLYVNFITVDTTIENYNATIILLEDNKLVFTNEYRPHQFEKISTINVTGNRRSEIKINPKKVAHKPAGALIPMIQ